MQVCELILGLLQEAPRLIDRGAVVGVVLLEQRRAFHDAVAALHADRGDEALLGRPDLDEIGLGIALPRDRRRRLGAEQNPAHTRDQGDQNRRDEETSNQGGRSKAAAGTAARRRTL